MRVGGDRREVHSCQVVSQLQIAENELVGEGLLDLGELLALAQPDSGARSGKGVGEDVERVDAVPAVHPHGLVDEPGNDAESFAGIEPQRCPYTGACSAVHVLVDAQVGLYRVDVASELVVVHHAPHGCFFT